MRTAQKFGFAMLAALTICVCSGVAHAQDYSPPAEMQEWLTATDHQAVMKPGAIITAQNWQQYKQFMPLAMQDFFQGKFFWKMPADIQMNVQETKIYPLPKEYVDATERYGSQTRVVHRPDGHNDLQGYVAGRPFPNPQEPDKGYKILANVWFAYLPHLYVNTPQNMANSCTQDRFNNISCTKIIFVYRQVGYNTDPGVPRDEPKAGDAWFTEWLMIEEPEESKYTTNLIVFHKNNELQQDSYVFVPALRRSLRLSVSSRCAPVAGSDYVQDDYKTTGFNGGLALFDAKYLGTRKILALTNDFQNVTGDFPNNWDMPLGWAKPSWGTFELRPTDIIDVRRVPAERPGYCYGSRIMFVDQVYTYSDWTEIYDSNLQLWKVFSVTAHAVDVPQIGRVVTNADVSAVWDVQNDHGSYFSGIDKAGHEPSFNQQVPADYQDFTRFSTPAGLMQIMR